MRPCRECPGCPSSCKRRQFVRSGEADVWGRRAVSLCIHAGSNDMAFRWLSQLGGIVKGSFQERAPRKIAENTVRFDGSQPPWWRWKFGGRNNTTVLTTSTSAICQHRFANVPAGSDVADFRCLMCTSAEPYFFWYRLTQVVLDKGPSNVVVLIPNVVRL